MEDKKEETQNTAKIIFIPVCSNCGQPLYDPMITLKGYKNENKMEVYPSECPSCNAKFIGVTISKPIISGDVEKDGIVKLSYANLLTRGVEDGKSDK